MEQSSFIVATSISVCFAICKFIEQKFIMKNDIVLKDIMRDTLIVYISALLGKFIIEQVSDVANVKQPLTAFTGAPDF